MLLCGYAQNALRLLSDSSIQTLITSPPYFGQRLYGVEGETGAEDTLDDYITGLVRVFAEARRVLTPTATMLVNVGDVYTSGNRRYRAPDRRNAARAMPRRPSTPPGLKAKDLIGIPWRLAFALQADGWWLRAEIIWAKPNAYPESVRDRPSRSHETVFLLSKNQNYHYNVSAVLGPGGRRLRSLWEIPTDPQRPFVGPVRHPPLRCLSIWLQDASASPATLAKPSLIRFPGREPPS